jgi:hypothetical protein
MRTPTVGAMTLLGLAAAMAAAPTALAESTPESSSPYPPPSAEIFITGDGRPQPGDHIGVVVRCPYPPGDAHSPVLKSGKLEKIDTPAGIDTYQAPAIIKSGTEPGKYPLAAGCGKNGVSTTFIVYPADASDDNGGGSTTGPDKSGAATEADTNKGSQVTRTPKGAPETGGEPGPDLSPLFWGAGLVGLGALGSAMLRRAVRR